MRNQTGIVEKHKKQANVSHSRNICLICNINKQLHNGTTTDISFAAQATKKILYNIDRKNMELFKKLGSSDIWDSEHLQ
jgi:hypothetical protein